METSKTTILVETTVNARIEKVWKAWTDPTVIMKWFGSDPNGKVLDAKLDVRAGGYFEVTFIDSDLTEHTCSGVYHEVQPFRRLSFTWHWKTEPGVESFIRLTLTPESDITRMQLEHSNLGVGSKHDYIKGWQSTFAKLERLLNTEM